MHRSEAAEATRCAVCGATIWIGQGRGYCFGSDRFLCWDCALERGGRYDPDLDEWTDPPNCSDVATNRGD